MKRPWQVWLIYSLCLIVILSGMGWLTLKVLEIDRSEAQARYNTEIERDISQALWNMDIELAPVIGLEIARPYFAYRPFYEEPQPQGRKLLAPSPLLTHTPSTVQLYFQCDSTGEWESPQVLNEEEQNLALIFSCPTSAWKDKETQLETLHTAIDPATLLALLPDEMLPDIAPTLSALNEGQEEWGAQREDYAFKTHANVYELTNQNEIKDTRSAWNSPGRWSAQSSENQEDPNQFLDAKGEEANSQEAQSRQRREEQDFERRSENYQTYTEQLVLQQRAINRDQYQYAPQAGPAESLETNPLDDAQEASLALPPQGAQAPQAEGEEQAGQYEIPDVAEGITLPLWVGDRLLLARRVHIDGELFIQGCWLHWPRIRALLFEQLPERLTKAGAKFQPIMPTDPAPHPSRALAVLPVQLVVPEMVAPAESRSPLRFALMVAWACLIVGALAVAALLSGVISLSERRSLFVSAVTHELRTPLTTFRMYAEMLAEGMVPEEKKRRDYLETLRVEADRLSHLVGNVLSFARLERTKKKEQCQPVSIHDLFKRCEGRLQDRAKQAGMQIEASLTEEEGALLARTDPASVEQILMNLVDNACKYATPAENKTIQIRIEQDRKAIHIIVRDFGPGIASSIKNRLFKPFSKSAEEAALSAPGIGLGLALCKRIANEIHAEIILSPTEQGASFRLSLPRV